MKKNILLIAGAMVLLVLLAVFVPRNQTTPGKTTAGNEMASTPVHGPHLTLAPEEYDFGKIRQSSGTVSKAFTVFNNGSEDVTIDEVLTSCSCTTAEIDKKLLRPGEQGTLTVVFDPNYHYEDDGRFFRTVTIKSNIHGKAPEVKIFVEVDYDLGKDALKFKGSAN
ncbi:MAG: DUF1573 domain-containing protein [Candidatus Yonathbacteria bacterium]|nr:DUF1573 domain-containing protein [Candidatus Yonathbacteria bacterium]